MSIETDNTEFDQLRAELAELAELRKAIPHTEPDGDEDENGEEPEEDEDDDMTKAFDVTLATGEKAQAIDGTALIKSMQNEMAAFQSQLLKANVEAVTLMKGLAADINDLKGQVATLQNQGRGRKSVVSIAEKPDATQFAKAEGMSSADFMLKASSALEQGKINAYQIALIESSLNNGHPVPPQLVASVLSS